MSSKPIKIVISGGGTGGHIFPAIAIADAMRSRFPDCKLLFVGALGRMEMQKVPQAGYEIKGLWISGFQRNLSYRNLSFPFKLILSMVRAWLILKRFNPDVVIGVGGYASGPTLRAAISLKIPTLIQEQNSFPGVTNRVLGKKVNTICVAYDHMETWFPKERTVLTGNPLRKTAVDIAGKKSEALKFFGLSPDKPVLLVVGGSQGAHSINKAIGAHLKDLVIAGIQLIWQTGESYFHRAVIQVEHDAMQETIKPHVFINRMDLAYAAATLIVSRAGAIAISEIAVVGKPAIFVPLPTASENHQMKNALRLSEDGAALVVENMHAEKQLIKEVTSLITDTKRLELMSAKLERFAITDAADRIANEITSLLKHEH
ncbi:MAG: undecaprenyldiphospho-muramoylpentapeptide beta-N-acetylglucosaminyltransferase [Bacteroidales bacterium]|nr:undecaprenyldiphospho-muramoylpentapeptide beta-N-acetylglucosaminyltransferase [Bacteroidales bacterium]